MDRTTWATSRDPSCRQAQRAIGQLEAAIDQLRRVDPDAFDADTLSEFLGDLRRPVARLGAVRTRLAGELTARRIAAAPPDRRAPATRAARTEVAGRNQQSPSEARTTTEAGNALREHPATAQAFADGKLREEHVRMIGQILTALEPSRRDEVETRLIDLAISRDPVAFGRAARVIANSHTPEHEQRNERHRHLHRRVRATDTPDGGFAFSGLLYGVQAETARVAMQAFRRPDARDEHRGPEQRSADAFEQLCASALRSEDAPVQHGSRPQVLVIIDTTHGDQEPRARFGSGQPVSIGRVTPLLADCNIARITLDAQRTPIEASELVRTVPAGLWRALVARDGGCTWDGCDAPPAWCDVAHGRVPFRNGGRLTPQNAALLCRRHHRQFDAAPWNITIDGDHVTYTRRTPRGRLDDVPVTDQDVDGRRSRPGRRFLPTGPSSTGRTPAGQEPTGIAPTQRQTNEPAHRPRSRGTPEPPARVVGRPPRVGSPRMARLPQQQSLPGWDPP